MMGEIFWSSLLNKSASFILILGPTVQDCSYWRRKNGRSAGRMAHASSEGCPTLGGQSAPERYMGEESPSPRRERGAVAGQGCCSAEHVRCLPCTSSSGREKGRPVSPVTRRVAATSCCPLKHIAVLAEPDFARAAASQRLGRAGLLRQEPFRGRGSDALMVGLAR